MTRQVFPVGLCSCLLFAVASAAHAQGTVAVYPESFVLAGMHEGRQLLVTAPKADDRGDDLTRKATYTPAKPGVVFVGPTGHVRPLGKGETTIIVEALGQKQEVKVVVEDADENKPLHFANDIEPLLSRHGCNAGGCHGRASGQNGFKLSLFRFHPAFDYAALVKEARGRRIFPASPDNSLILTKATGRVPHGGGKRIAPDSEDY